MKVSSRTSYIPAFLSNKLDKFVLFYRIEQINANEFGLLENCLLILTGSSAYDLKRSSERLPGRKGFGKDLVYTPITFREFLRSMKIDVEGKAMEELLSLSLEELKTLQFRYSFLEEYFLKFLNTGGFPKAIDDFLKEGKNQRNNEEDLSRFRSG